MILTKKNYLLKKTQKNQIIFLLVSMVVAASINMLGVTSVLPFILVCERPDVIHQNRYLSDVYNFFHFTSESHFLVFLGVMSLFGLLFSNGLSLLVNYMSAKFTSRLQESTSGQLLAEILSRPYEYVLNKNSSVLSSIVLEVVTRAVKGYLNCYLNFISNILVIAFIAIALLVIKPLQFIFIFSFFSITFTLVYLVLKKSIDKINKKSVVIRTQRAKLVYETLSNIKTIKLYHNEALYLNLFNKYSKEFCVESSFETVLTQVPRNIIEMIAFGFLIISLIIVVLEFHNFSQVMPVIALYVIAGYRLLPSMSQLLQYYARMKTNKASFDEVNQLIEHPFNCELLEKSDKADINFIDSIQLKNIFFSYQARNEKSVLNGVNFSIRKNSVVAIIGHTGAGKSTLVDLIIGLLKPTSGSIEVDGIAIDDTNIESWQKKIGYVPQSMYLFDDTILRNITLDHTAAEQKDLLKVYDAAKQAQLHDFIINELPDGYNTIVGERGVCLSGGQQQRLAIARALYRQPEILIFDEATSALDNDTELAIMQSIYSFLHCKTIIIIAHRLSTVVNADVVYVLKHGKVVDRGSFHEVNERNNLVKERVA